jgi:hypothetical protein
MRTLAILILFCASLYGADSTTTNIVGDITTKVSGRTAKDGKPEVRIETVYRGKTKVLLILSRRNRQGVLAVVSRSYLVNGKLSMVESDEDGDGFFESVAVFDPVTDDFEMFTRQPDGTVKPVSTQILRATKKQKAAADGSLRTLLQNPNMSDKEMSNLLEENRQKIEDIEKEKKD